MFLTVLQVTPENNTATDRSSESCGSAAPQDDTHTYKATPLSTSQTFITVSFLALYSFIYLVYAQHHKVLFYVMTSLIVIWIVFIYTAGIMSVVYMIVIGYDEKPQESFETDVEAQQESPI